MKNATLVITHAEVCDRRGGGALLRKIFAADPAMVVVYSHPLFAGDCAGALAIHLEQPPQDPVAARRQLEAELEGVEVERVLCVPHFPDQAVSAIAASELTGAPLVTYVMDDRNLFTQAIPDQLMSQLVTRSSICFAISEQLRSGYGRKFGEEFWILPPINERRLFAPPGFAGPGNDPPRGVLIGNLWSQRVLEDLRQLIRTTGRPLHWYGNAGKPYINLEPQELAADGIALSPNLADELLAPQLRRFDYGIMPMAIIGDDPKQDWLARSSLPSRLIYMITVANLPLVVLGDRRSAAAEFVLRFQLGVTSSYAPEDYEDAVEAILADEAAIRSRAADLSPKFASEPVASWIWRLRPRGAPRRRPIRGSIRRRVDTP